MRRGELRALLLREAYNLKAGACFTVARAVRPLGVLQATSELTQQIERAIEGFQHYIVIERNDAAGNVVIRVLRTPPEFYKPEDK